MVSIGAYIRFGLFRRRYTLHTLQTFRIFFTAIVLYILGIVHFPRFVIQCNTAIIRTHVFDEKKIQQSVFFFNFLSYLLATIRVSTSTFVFFGVSTVSAPMTWLNKGNFRNYGFFIVCVSEC